MKLIALDTVRISSAGGRLEAGQEFEVSGHEGEVLVARGLAVAPGDYVGKARRKKAPVKSKAKGKAAADPAPALASDPAPSADPAPAPASEPASQPASGETEKGTE